MSRLPTRLQPFWPWFKRAHRLLSLILGVVFRTLPSFGDERALPRHATTSSLETARLEPQTARLHPIGPAESLRRTMPIGTPAGHPVFARGLSVEVPERYLLELDRGLVVGDFGAHVTAGGVLDYETSGYFGLAGWREHPVFLHPRLPAIEPISGTVLDLVSRGAGGNYYHFLFDVLPRLGIFEETMPGRRVDAVVVHHATRYQKQLLELAGCPGPWIQPQADRSVRGDTLLVPSTPNQDLAAPVWAVDWLRKRLPATPHGERPRRIYITRGNKPNTRRYVHEEALLPALLERGFVVVDPGTYTVQEQIDIFSGADVILSPHGAGLSNVVFAQPGVRVLELFAAGYVHLGLFAICAALEGAEYRYLVAEGAKDPERAITGVLEDVDIAPEQVLAALDDLMR